MNKVKCEAKIWGTWHAYDCDRSAKFCTDDSDRVKLCGVHANAWERAGHKIDRTPENTKVDVVTIDKARTLHVYGDQTVEISAFTKTGGSCDGVPSGWSLCGQCGTQWIASDGAVLPCPICSDKNRSAKP
jgi:hypothetical protein